LAARLLGRVPTRQATCQLSYLLVVASRFSQFYGSFPFNFSFAVWTSYDVFYVCVLTNFSPFSLKCLSSGQKAKKKKQPTG